MAGTQTVPSRGFKLSSLRSSTALTIAGTAIGGALAACMAAAVINPGLSVGAHFFNWLFVAGSAATIGAVASLGQSKTSPVDAEVRGLSQSVRSLLRDPNLVQRIPVSSDSVVGELSSDLNVLIDSFETRQSSLQKTVDDMRDMRDRSESASLAKSHFLANMSHELRTPLNAIIGYAMLLQEDAQNAGETEAVSDLDRILRAARHLLMLINDILDLSKIEAGKDEVDYTPINLRTLIDECLVALGPRSSEDGVEFILNLPEDEVFMQTDTMKVRQCLVNLLSNAFKFTETGSVTLSAECRSSDAGQDVVLEVADTGIGINEDKIEKLFDAFVQADTSTTQKYGGTGLGLAITQKLAKLLGGNLFAESEEGKGSVFTLIIPKEPISELRALDLDEVATELPANDDGNSERLALVIDDDSSTVDLLTRWLKKQGYVVAAAYDGEAGLEVAEEYHPDLILLDIHMPRKNGWDVLEKLNAHDTLKDVPVIIVSVDDDRKRGLDSGASEYLTKPTNQGHLISVLETYNTHTAGHILVVDDDEDAGNIIERAARQVGLDVSRAFDGVTGLEMARAHKPCAIVLDLTMPRKDGFSVLAELGIDPELRKIPVIVVSARTLNGDEFNQISQSGCDFHAKGVSSPHDIAANLISVVNE